MVSTNHNTIYHKMEIRFLKHIYETHSATMNTIMANTKFWVAFIHKNKNSSNMHNEISWLQKLVLLPKA